jgi:hypothetical protein
MAYQQWCLPDKSELALRLQALLQAAQPHNDRVADPVHDLTHHTESA